MRETELKKEWMVAQKAGFTGWDFSRIAASVSEDPLPWEYKQIVLAHIKPKDQLLDMGTGGGEFLLELGHPYDNTTVTEAWEPNVKLCKEKLAPLGIRVEQVFEDAVLPFEDNAFDLVINRHEAYDISEVRRILKPGGRFITQQVGGRNNEWLSRFLIEDFQPEYPGLFLQNEKEKFLAHGFIIEAQQEAFPFMRFYDVAAIVYYAKILEWEFPGFSVETHFERLKSLQEMLLERGFIETLEHRFFLVARNTK
ncbi:class I SAM-dependent methyltransferase [Jeotgalibacillus sp. ET6]|uniref:class I SAM-dependent methyltransferase n=1 Tax=Jeotgalibacillus sp. ET6 TaxID=3037260 RepID=UPI002418918C|nr:class I SAM-dependent methyltransferase [Jeotgalibacillus sp. ET6]MDG5472333.1 class I SAM-dependent methyltransferase [Jeotgalibacillus sp. ET6]